MTEETKVCNQCHLTLPTIDFYKNYRRKCGTYSYRGTCKTCVCSISRSKYTPTIKQTPTADHRFCSCCKVELHNTNFYKDNTKRDNLSTWCKPCSNLYASQYRVDNKVQLSVISKVYYEANRAYILKSNKTYRNLHKEDLRLSSALYAKENPHVFAAKGAKRRSNKKQATPVWENHEQVHIKEIYNLAATKTKLTGIKHHVDHIVPLTGDYVCGLHCKDNLQVITAVSNLEKGNRWWPNM